MTPRRANAGNVNELLRLLDFSRDLMQVPDLRSAMELIGPVISELLLSDHAFLLVFLGDQEHGVSFDYLGSIQPAHQETALYQCARQAMENDEAPLLFTNETGGLAAQVRNPPELQGATVLAVPFPLARPVGALVVCWNKKKRRQFLAKRVSLLHHLVNLIGAAFGNLGSRQELERQIHSKREELADVTEEHAQEMSRRDRVEEEIRHIAITDVMTGLHNRRGFFLQAEQSFKVAKRKRLESAVIFADVDGLKKVNDRLGHEVGDQLLRDSAEVLRNSFRASDVIARLGGDEFAAYTLEATNPDAILNRIKEKIEVFNGISSRPYQVAFSTGIVQCDPLSSLTLADYLLMADTQMYMRKKERATSLYAK
jgi:diguanylate cyclase (GGDEF)-like protein